MKADEPRRNRIPFMMSDAELASIDDWRFSKRLGTRADAIRRLCQIGLAYDRDGKALVQQTSNALRASVLLHDLLRNSSLSDDIRGAFAIVLAEQLQAAEIAASMAATSVVFSQDDVPTDELIQHGRLAVSHLLEGPG